MPEDTVIDDPDLSPAERLPNLLKLVVVERGNLAPPKSFETIARLLYEQEDGQKLYEEFVEPSIGQFDRCQKTVLLSALNREDDFELKFFHYCENDYVTRQMAKENADSSRF